eukprot:1154605-Pelagomonas_calceolata.AAC.13
MKIPPTGKHMAFSLYLRQNGMQACGRFECSDMTLSSDVTMQVGAVVGSFYYLLLTPLSHDVLGYKLYGDRRMEAEHVYPT